MHILHVDSLFLAHMLAIKKHLEVVGQKSKWFLSASLYVSKRGAY